jgi:hypothetical protein
VARTGAGRPARPGVCQTDRMSDGSTGPSGRMRELTPGELANNRRKAAKVILAMLVFFVGLVVLASWAAVHG